jgi:hypothetical protein
MDHLGKEPASQQILKYGLTYTEAKAIAGDTHLLLDHYPKGRGRIPFLCMTRLRRTDAREWFEPFSTEYLRGFPNNNRRMTALANESLDFLSRPALKIQAIQLIPISKLTCVKSPYHQNFLEGDYGTKAVLKKKKKPEVLSVPRFDPKSAGVSTVLAGKWACLKCSTVHQSCRALHVCDSCSSLPLRQAKVDAPPNLYKQIH